MARQVPNRMSQETQMQEEKERVITEARKNVIGPDGRTTTLPNLIEDRFPLTRPDWDFRTPEGRERLLSYCQTLMTGLRPASRRPTNLAKVKAIEQGVTESPTRYLERIYDAYRQYTPLDPLAEENQSAVIMTFINQAAPDIRRKLHKQEELGSLSIKDLLRIADRVYNLRETAEEREERLRRETQEREDRVGWPREGSFSGDLISKVKAVITRPGVDGHPDQLPYILLWQEISENPPAWLKALTPSPWDPPPDPMMPQNAPTEEPQGPSIPSSSEKVPALVAAGLDPIKARPGPLVAQKGGIYPSLLDLDVFYRPPAQNRRVQAELSPEPLDPTAIPTAPDEPPEYSLAREGEEPFSPTNLRPRPEIGVSPPQGQGKGPRVPGKEGNDVPPIHAFPVRAIGSGEEDRVYQYWPFSSSDLYNWRSQNPPFSKDPIRLTDLIGSIMNTHEPTWDDCQQLLSTLLSSEEKERVITEARKNVIGPDGRTTTLPNLIEDHFPLTRPDWDFRTPEGRERLLSYRQTLMTGLRAASRRPTNLAKVKAIEQGVTESPTRYLERIYDAYRQYTPLDPLPDSPAPLLGRDLLTKVQAHIRFQPKGITITDGQGDPITVFTLSLADEHRLFENRTAIDKGKIEAWIKDFPQAWAETGGIGLAINQYPIVVELKPTAEPIRIKQYPIKPDALEGITPHIDKLLQAGILKPCRSAWNTPLLPVKKPEGKDYRPVQDLRKVNERVMDIHPTVPNPYTLLSQLPPHLVWYTVLDLKDAFFSIPLAPTSQTIFAFEWKGSQLTWTRLPQGFKNSPTIFNEALNMDLRDYRTQHPKVTLLQYVDDLLLAAETKEECLEATRGLLQELGRLGYLASAKKAQLCKTEVTYLGYKLERGQRWLTDAMKETILQTPVPKSPREVREFLGTAGYCRLWIPRYAEISQPLHQASREGVPWEWGPPQQKAYEGLRAALLSAPALALPDPSKPFQLFLDKKKGIAKGVLVQRLGPWKRPVAYLSKRLDPVAAGWPPCLRIIAATALLVKDADKLTFGQALAVTTPHAIERILKQPPGKWMSNARLTHYQALLLDTPRITFKEPQGLNPATLLPTPKLGKPLHSCTEILAEIMQVRSDLRDEALVDNDLVWFTDGSSFVLNGVRKAGAAVVDIDGKVIWKAALPAGTSAQKAELVTLSEALEKAEGKRLTVYTDSRYAFATVHVHGAIYRERGFQSAEGKALRNLEEVQRLLAAVLLPKAVAVVHIPGHQKATTPEAKGNAVADRVARKAALDPPHCLALVLPAPEEKLPGGQDQPQNSFKALKRSKKYKKKSGQP
ncbi:PREDICTED: uncharacterized protein LOC102833547 [Chrysochloris asiatica]|uniref:Uncharacterized protein LOC102833547 n=1 Tax=Chrysochloris asiatica TaxID=185453 RepID=A0A9B0WU11_CHRAS|nr:PREDICTED: uncharacterized protein LOC102833547 [Chrysochloris asiatica]